MTETNAKGSATYTPPIEKIYGPPRDLMASDGTVHPSDGVFDEVVEPERFVLVSGVEDDDGTQRFEVRQTVTFEERGSETLLTLEAEVQNATADAAEHLEGMEEGLSQSFGKLDDFLVASVEDEP